MKTALNRFAAVLVVSLLVAGAGCATQDAEARAAKKKAAEEEYVYITVTGSNIPKRIKKSDVLNGDLPKDGDAQVIDKEQFQRQMRQERRVDRGGG